MKKNCYAAVLKEGDMVLQPQNCAHAVYTMSSPSFIAGWEALEHEKSPSIIEMIACQYSAPIATRTLMSVLDESANQEEFFSKLKDRLAVLLSRAKDPHSRNQAPETMEIYQHFTEERKPT